MIKQAIHISSALYHALETACEKGLIERNAEGELSPHQLFPFTLADVEGLHIKQGSAGDAVYFQLITGQIFNELGEEIHPDNE